MRSNSNIIQKTEKYNNMMDIQCVCFNLRQLNILWLKQILITNVFQNRMNKFSTVKTKQLNFVDYSHICYEKKMFKISYVFFNVLPDLKKENWEGGRREGGAIPHMTDVPVENNNFLFKWCIFFKPFNFLKFIHI